MIDLILRNVITQDNPDPADIAVDQGAILEVGPGLKYTARQEMDLGGRLLIPGFVESHVHLDIALMNSGSHPGRPEPFRSVANLNVVLENRRRNFTRAEIVERASTGLRRAARHGVTALRSQCHVDLEVGLQHLEALLAVKEKFAGQLDLQIVTFPQQGLLRNRETIELFREAFRLGADVMGCASNLDVSPSGKVDFRKHILAAFDLALELDVDLDIHADLALADQVELDDLEVVFAARRAIEVGYQGRVTAGHVSTLDSALPEVAAQAIALIKEAGISVVSQPDLYRLGRGDIRHKRRGLTRVKELLEAGVNVTYASNNVRDALRPLGNFDLLEEGLVLAYGAHLDTIADLETILKMSTYHAAQALRLSNYGLRPGCSADLVVLDAGSPSAAIVNQSEKNFVFKAGKLIAANRRENDYFGE